MNLHVYKLTHLVFKDQCSPKLSIQQVILMAFKTEFCPLLPSSSLRTFVTCSYIFQKVL